LTGKAEGHFYLALQQAGRYQDQTAVSHAQKSLTVSTRLSLSRLEGQQIDHRCSIYPEDISIEKFDFFRPSMMLCVCKRITPLCGRSTAMHVCFFIR
jgi:hypothetical protein